MSTVKLLESFVYLWYDAPNNKYYLGKHKGTPDDSYTHSSTIWEPFTKDTIPEGVSRRILAYGTDKEMCKLEHKLLVNRYGRCWNMYYNKSLGDPRYMVQDGVRNPNFSYGFYSYLMPDWLKKEYRHDRDKINKYRKVLKTIDNFEAEGLFWSYNYSSQQFFYKTTPIADGVGIRKRETIENLISSYDIKIKRLGRECKHFFKQIDHSKL